MVTGAARTWLRVEGAAAFAIATGAYLRFGGNLWALIPLLLAVDLSIAGYLAGPRIGAVAYNALHNWALGLVLLALGLTSGSDLVVVASSVLIAHVGMDRMGGYGLKYPTAFADTHLGRIGRTR